MGCDFLPVGSLKGFGPVKALKLVTKYRDLKRVLWLMKRDSSIKVRVRLMSTFDVSRVFAIVSITYAYINLKKYKA